MGLLRDRTRFWPHGLGTVEIRQVSPTPDVDHADIGFIQESTIEDIYETEKRFDEIGNLTNVLEKSHAAAVRTKLMQVGIDEINLIKNSKGMKWSLRYRGISKESGRFQYNAFDQVILGCVNVIADEMNPADGDYHDISSFRVRRLHPPQRNPGWFTVTPEQWALHLRTMRRAMCTGLDIELDAASPLPVQP